MHTALCACVVIMSIAAGSTFGDELFVTANSQVDQVCLSGEPYRGPMPNAKNKFKLDKIWLPNDWRDNEGRITIKARNKKGKYGIIGFIKSSPMRPQGINWKCKPVKLIPNEDCCDWDGSGGGVSFWGVDKPFTRLIPPGQRRMWVWSAAPWNRVCCKIAPCSPFCSKCKSAGPWKCDRGRCLPGTKWNPATWQCDRICRVMVVTSPFAQARMVSWNVVTEKQYTWPMQEGNAYIAMIDPLTCNFINKEWRPAASASDLTNILANWNLGTTYINYVSVEAKVNTETSPGSGVFLTLVFTRTNTGNGNPATTEINLTGPIDTTTFNVYYPVPAFWEVNAPWFKIIEKTP